MNGAWAVVTRKVRWRTNYPDELMLCIGNPGCPFVMLVEFFRPGGRRALDYSDRWVFEVFGLRR